METCTFHACDKPRHSEFNGSERLPEAAVAVGHDGDGAAQGGAGEYDCNVGRGIYIICGIKFLKKLTNRGRISILSYFPSLSPKKFQKHPVAEAVAR